MKELQERVSAFMEKHIYPNEQRFLSEVEANRNGGNAWIPTEIIEELKPKARAEGLWNLWRPKGHGGTLTNLEYAPLCEIMGRVSWAPEVFNCSAPDTGNMETILRYGNPEHHKAVGGTAACRGNTFRISDDRARSRVIRCDQYPVPN